MPAAHSSPSLAVSASSWKISRYDTLPLWIASKTYVSAEKKGKQTGDRVVGTPGRKARRSALQARGGGGCRRTRKKNETGTVSTYSLRTTKRRV